MVIEFSLMNIIYFLIGCITSFVFMFLMAYFWRRLGLEEY